MTSCAFFDLQLVYTILYVLIAIAGMPYWPTYCIHRNSQMMIDTYGLYCNKVSLPDRFSIDTANHCCNLSGIVQY
jgi:hypothetical protein